MSESAEESSSMSDEESLSASAKLRAGQARGYTFQDVIAGACILSVFFEDANTVTVESKLEATDKFDDIVLEKSDETICLQLKNGPKHKLISSDLTGSNERGLDFKDLSDSAEARREADEGSRFVVLTSFIEDSGSGIEFSDGSEDFSIWGGLEFRTKELHEFRGGDVEDESIEFVLGVPGIGTTSDEEEINSPRNTELFERIVENVSPRLDIRENPEIDDPENLTESAVTLARWARNQPADIGKLDRDEIIRRLELIPSEKFSHQLGLPDEYIHPRWIENLEDAYDDPDNRILVEGAPGSGKSVGIELFHRAWEDLEDHRTLRFYFYIPEDADSLEIKRRDPEWFRHQLAYQLYSTFPEAFGRSNSVPVWTGIDDLQEYIDNVAQWADQEDQRVLFIFDGLDHALRPFGGTEATEPAEGSALEEIGKLDFPEPLGLLMVSREISESHDTLRVDQNIEVPAWNSNEIREYLAKRDVNRDDELIEDLSTVSGGLPVIISHIATKTEIQGDNIEEVIEDASHVDGVLEDYYDTIWEPLEPFERDVATLVALNPTGLHKDTIDSVIDIPYTVESTRLEDAPLAHILDPISGNQFRVFHDSFRKYTKDLLDEEEISRGHTRLFNHLFDQCIQFPQNLDSLRYHAENGRGYSELKDLATLDNLLQWWQDGIYFDHLSNTLGLAFEASLQQGDYISAFDCVILGGVARDMLETYTDDGLRLSYYAAQGNRDRALRLVDQVQRYKPGSQEAIEAMQTVARNWDDELGRTRLESWENDFQEGEQPDINPESYIEVASNILDAEEFWELAEQIKRLDTGEHFPREVLAAVEKKPELFEHQPEPPDWFFENESLALESCENLIHDLPDAWREELRAHAPEYSGLSFAALHVLLRCGDVKDEILEVVEDRELDEPLDTPDQADVQFNDVYYAGSIIAALVETPADLLDTVDEIAVDQPKIQKLLALMGAAATRESSAQKQLWVDETLEYLEDRVEEGYLLDSSARNVDEFRYWRVVSDISSAFSEVADHGSEDLFRRVFEMLEEISSGDRFFDTISMSLNRAWEELSPGEALPRSLDLRYEELLNRPPMEEPPSRDLMNLAVRAAEKGYNSRAEKYEEKAVERCFRYGYRKDTFLSDVWSGFEDLVDDDWVKYHGKAIQLTNWANLLHEMTDGKETRHYEGIFLKSLLDSGMVDYHTVEEYAEQATTVRKVWDWRLENPRGMNKAELSRLIDSKEMKIRSGSTSHMGLPFFSKAAIVADDFGWGDLVEKSLSALGWGDYVRNGISDDRKGRLRELASEYNVDIPDNLESNSGSTDIERGSNETEDDKSDIKNILSEHSEDDPLNMDDFDDLTTEELSEAGDLLQDNSFDSTRYDPTAAAPISRLLADRGNKDQAILLLENVIAERDLIDSWLGGGSNRFEIVAGALLDIDEERALQSVLNGWDRSRLDTEGYQSIFPQLLWIVKRTEGEIAADEFFSHVMGWTRRLMWPHEDRIQKWGVLDTY
jgi:hypothetical protein